MKITKELRQIIASLLIIGGIITFLIPVSSAESVNPLANEPAVVNLLASLSESGDFLNVKTLKDANDADRYYYLPFSSGGYLIYDAQLDIISEYSTFTHNDYIESTDLVYYTGALQYFTKSGDIFMEIPTGNELGSEESFVSYANDIDSKAKRNTMRRNIALSDTNAAHYISGTVPNYSHNPDGICGSTAAAMLLRWYDLYQNSNYVPSSLESTNGVALIEHLRSYIDGDNPGSDPGDVYFGILDYCADQGVSHAGGIENYSDTYVMGRVDTYEIPFLLSIRNHPKYGNHWVTGYGYNYSGGTCYSIVNDGWGSRGIAINPIYVTQIVW